MSSSFFLTTRNRGLYNKVTEICKNHWEFKKKKNIVLKEIKIKKILLFRVNSIILLIKKIIYGHFFNDYKFFKIKYLNCDLGRHAISATYNHLNSHLNPITKNYYKLFYFLYGKSILDFVNLNKKNISASFIDHGVYINGVLINFFSINKIPFYTNSYPRGLYLKKNIKKKISYEDLIKIEYPKLNTKFKIIKKEKFKWPWVFNKKFFKLKKEEIKSFNYVIYCHAFTDGLLANGYDGFIRMDAWLRFTINTLLEKKNKILVKIHPNFHKYNNHFRSAYEVKIFNKIIQEFKHNKQIKFIDYPVSNMQLMKTLNKKTILITHHGTPVLESVAFGFKVISSGNTHWDNQFKLSNIWRDKKEYKKILKKDYKDLKFGSSKDLYKLLSIIFNNKYGVHGKNYFVKLINSENKKYIKNIYRNIDEM